MRLMKIIELGITVSYALEGRIHRMVAKCQFRFALAKMDEMFRSGVCTRTIQPLQNFSLFQLVLVHSACNRDHPGLFHPKAAQNADFAFFLSFSTFLS